MFLREGENIVRAYSGEQHRLDPFGSFYSHTGVASPDDHKVHLARRQNEFSERVCRARGLSTKARGPGPLELTAIRPYAKENPCEAID